MISNASFYWTFALLHVFLVQLDEPQPKGFYHLNANNPELRIAEQLSFAPLSLRLNYRPSSYPEPLSRKEIKRGQGRAVFEVLGGDVNRETKCY